MIDRLDDQQIDLVLKRHHIGRVGCYIDGRPYIVPVTYVYEDGYVYGRSDEGMKIKAMRQHPVVCFEVEDIDDMRSWRSVIAWGSFEELHDSAADRAFDLLVRRLAPHASSRTFLEAGEASYGDYRSHGIQVPSRRGVIYRIHLTERTGRFEKHE
jgi:nitroimidazol reductase NimA-like FMN-containing flavoprotein (pyridoxamine 5'-phosphate oxidase superfamily)